MNAEGAPPKKKPVDARARRFNYAGGALAALLVGFCVAVFGLSIFELDNWKSYFYRDTLDFGGLCQAAYQANDALAFPTELGPLTPFPVPHTPADTARVFKTGGPGKVHHLYYRCELPRQETASAKGVHYVHLGWAVGESTEIRVNGTPTLAYDGPDKVVLPIDQRLLVSGPTTIEVRSTSHDLSFLGLLSNLKMVLAHGDKANSLILGVTVALSKMRPLYQLLPTLTLGLVLVFGWFFGTRSRLVLTTMTYFALSAASHMVLAFSSRWPWDAIKDTQIVYCLTAGSTLAFFLFGAELLKVAKLPTLSMVGGVFAATAAATLAVFLDDNANPVWTERLQSGLSIIAPAVLLILGIPRVKNWERKNRFDIARQRVNGLFLGFLGFLVAVAAVDVVQTEVIVFQYANLLMPFFIGGIVLYSLSIIEKSYQHEKQERAKMEGELTLAAKLQDVLLPKERHGEGLGWSYLIDSKPFGILGGDWIKVFRGKRGLFLVLGDVVGKGASAALTHSGLAAAWETNIKLWDADKMSAAELLTSLNDVMFELFKGGMNTTFAAVEITDLGVNVASGGNYWLHLAQAKSKPLSPGRHLLGIQKDFKVTFNKVEFAPGDWLLCFTDGVLEGNRPIKRFIADMQERVEGMRADDIVASLKAAGQGVVHPDDASLLLLHAGMKALPLSA